jgi:Rrf2 family transcriptional regulator, cysteine metabolism repressor
MYISTPCRYTIRAMLELAKHFGERPISLKEIEQAQNISWRYLQQLMPALKREGLVRVTKGNRGGFMLSRHPSEITINDIIKAQTGCISLVDCVIEPEQCDFSEKCPSRDIWVAASKLLEDFFSSLNLDSVLEKVKLKEEKK